MWEAVSRVWISEELELNQGSLNMNLPTYCFSFVLSSGRIRSGRLEITDRVEKLINAFNYDSIYVIKCGSGVTGEDLQKHSPCFSEFILLAWSCGLYKN